MRESDAEALPCALPLALGLMLGGNAGTQYKNSNRKAQAAVAFEKLAFCREKLGECVPRRSAGGSAFCALMHPSHPQPLKAVAGGQAPGDRRLLRQGRGHQQRRGGASLWLVS